MESLRLYETIYIVMKTYGYDYAETLTTRALAAFKSQKAAEKYCEKLEQEYNPEEDDYDITEYWIDACYFED